jgi:hypothetical protein
VGHSLSQAAGRRAERTDRMELWRIADRVARHAEARLPRDSQALLQNGTATPDVEQALVLRRRANELLLAALGDAGHGGRDVPRPLAALPA